MRSTRNVCTQPQKPPHAFGTHDGERSRSSHESPEYRDDARRRVDDVASDGPSDASDDPAAVTLLNDAIAGGEVAVVFASSDILG